MHMQCIHYGLGSPVDGRSVDVSIKQMGSGLVQLQFAFANDVRGVAALIQRALHHTGLDG